MPKFRKKPVEIEAFQFNGTRNDLPPWASKGLARGPESVGNMRFHQQLHGDPPHALILTLEGVMRANLGDWIIQGVKGEIYPCKPNIFAATYDPV